MDIYIISYLATLFSLCLWQVFQRGIFSQVVSSVFYLCLFIYAGICIQTIMMSNTSIINIVRDVLILGGVSYFFMLVKENKMIALASLVFFGSSMPMIYEYMMENRTKPAPTSELTLTQNHSSDLQVESSNELLLEILPGFEISDIKSIQNQYNLEIVRAFFPEATEATDLDDYYSINIPDQYESRMSEIAKKLISHRAVEWLEYNERLQYEPIESQDDVIAPPISKYAVNDPLNSQKWEYAPLQMNEYYNYIKTQNIKPRNKAKLFILDTGVDGEHEDLKQQYKKYNDNGSKDEVGHGTHCAGIAASVSNNKIGVSSAVPNGKFVEVSSIKVLSGFGFGTQKAIIDGMIKAVDAGADVISMSLGGKSSETREKAYTEAVQYALRKNVIVVIAAGNAGKNAAQYSPANSEGVITVAAVDQNLKRTIFSNTLQHIKYGVSAPGKDIFSTYPNNEYKVYSGTSMAAPYVAGLVSVLKSIKPEMDVAEAFRILHATGMTTQEPYKTGHMIQPYDAVKLLIEEMSN